MSNEIDIIKTLKRNFINDIMSYGVQYDTTLKISAALETAITSLAAPSAANGAATCPVCKGNDADMPCAYPSERVNGCLRDVRLSANGAEMPEPVYLGGDEAFGDVVMGYTAEQLRAAVLAERAACSIINFRAIVGLSHEQCSEVMQAIRART